jgi:hypothetical protein
MTMMSLPPRFSGAAVFLLGPEETDPWYAAGRDAFHRKGPRIAPMAGKEAPACPV